MTRLLVDNLLSGDSLIYNLDVSLVSDFLDSLTPENMNVASLALADTDEDDLFGDLEVFELPHYGVDHAVGELKKIKVNAKRTLPSTFVVEGAQTVEDEKCEETLKEKRALLKAARVTKGWSSLPKTLQRMRRTKSPREATTAMGRSTTAQRGAQPSRG